MDPSKSSRVIYFWSNLPAIILCVLYIGEPDRALRAQRKMSRHLQRLSSPAQSPSFSAPRATVLMTSLREQPPRLSDPLVNEQPRVQMSRHNVTSTRCKCWAAGFWRRLLSGFVSIGIGLSWQSSRAQDKGHVDADEAVCHTMVPAMAVLLIGRASAWALRPPNT